MFSTRISDAVRDVQHTASVLAVSEQALIALGGRRPRRVAGLRPGAVIAPVLAPEHPYRAEVRPAVRRLSVARVAYERAWGVYLRALRDEGVIPKETGPYNVIRSVTITGDPEWFGDATEFQRHLIDKYYPAAGYVRVVHRINGQVVDPHAVASRIAARAVTETIPAGGGAW